MTWKRVRRAGSGEGALEVESNSGAVVGPARTWFLVPEDAAPDCCFRLSEKPPIEPGRDPHEGFLIVPAAHIEERHPESVD